MPRRTHPTTEADTPMQQHRWTADKATPYRPQTYMSEEDRLPHGKFHDEPFMFVYYSTSWMYHDEHGFLPQLSRISFKAGCNGVAGRKGQAPDPSGALVGATRKGGVLLSPDNPRLGRWGRYVVSYETNLGNRSGKHFCWKFDEFQRVGARDAAQSDTSDAWWAFLLFLRDDSGLIPLPPEHSVSRIISIQEDRVDRMGNKIISSGGDTGKNAAYKAAAAKLEAMREAAARLFRRDIESKAPRATIGGAQEADLGVNLSAIAQQAAATETASEPTETAPAVRRRKSSKES